MTYREWLATIPKLALMPERATDKDVTRLANEVMKLRKWIENESVSSDICVEPVLGVICQGCRCPKDNPPTVALADRRSMK